MAVPNPVMNPPRLPSPSKRSLQNRSPSRSPVRQHRARDTDSLLRDLSPTATLRAFSTRGSDELSRDQLGRSADTATHSQRALGAKAAQAGLHFRLWVRELEGWEWPGTFEVPEPMRKKQRIYTMSSMSTSSRPSMQVEEDMQDYSGSLPTSTIQVYSARIEKINEGLDEIDVEELKEFVLSAHSRASYGEASIDDSIGAIAADTNLRRLDDFTALITATILQALPYLSRLTRLLHTWTLRLSILRSTPLYLQDLAQARTDLDHGWAALAISNHPAAADAMKRAAACFTRETMLEMKSVLERQVYSLGKRLDGYLDVLEGREECVPDRWIEEFEVLEEQYGSWVVQAERKVLEREWKVVEEPAAFRDPYDLSQRIDEDDEDARAGAADVEQDEYEVDDRPRTASTIVGPTATTTITGSGSSSKVNTSTYTSTHGPLTTTVTTEIPISSPTRQRTIEHDFDFSSRNSSPSRSARHIPIVVEGYDDGQSQTEPVELPTSTNQTVPLLPVPTTESGTDIETASQKVKRRAAFLNGDIERSDSLIKSKSPPIVRPFEHASNAFTRLFKRDQHSRSGENGEGGEAGRSLSLGGGSSSSKRRDKEKETAKDGGSSKRSSSSKRREKEKGSDRHSQLSSVSSTSSIPRSSQSLGSKQVESSGRRSLESRPKMGYGDMVWVPPPPSESSEKRRNRRARDSDGPTTPKREKARRMEYGDLVGVPTKRGSAENRPTPKRERSASGSVTKKQKERLVDTKQSLGYGDLVSLPSPQPQQQVPSRDTKQNLGYMDSLDFSSQQQQQQHLTASPGTKRERVMLGAQLDDDLNLVPAALSTPQSKRSSKQNITALPVLAQEAPLQRSPSPTKKVPETYRPSGLKTPFHSATEVEHGFDVPEDWPLSTPHTPIRSNSPTRCIATESMDGSASADHQSDRAPATDYFDNTFVQDVQPSPMEAVSPIPKSDERRVLFDEERDISASPPDSQSDSEGFVVKASPLDRSWMRTGVNRQSRRLDLTGASLARPVSMVEEADENEEVSEIESSEDDEEYGLDNTINAARYFGASNAKALSVLGEGPKAARSPRAMDEGMKKEYGFKSTMDEYGIKDTLNSKPARYSGTAAKALALLGEAPRANINSRTVTLERPTLAQRSKSTPPLIPLLTRLRIPSSSPEQSAFEQVQEERGAILRRASATSIEAHPRSQLKSIEVVRPRSVASSKSVPSTPRDISGLGDMRTSGDEVRSPTSPLSYKGSMTLPSPPAVPPRSSSMRDSPEAKPKVGRTSFDLNALAMPKQRKYRDVPKTTTGKNLPLQPGEDNFDRHVSEVLDRVHAPIKFNTRPGAETPQSQRPTAKLPKGLDRPGKNLTLAPAEPSPKKATAADPEVKLYHLTQSGRSEPIKLYVRLVGEAGDRVMVRVGGGWADLADYLRQYAEHHGSRTASESLLELHTASNSPASANGGLGKRTFSGPVEPKARTPITPIKSGFPSLERPSSRKSERLWLGTDQPRFTMGDSDDERSPSTRPYSRDSAFGTQRSPPRSSAAGSRPSTSQSTRNSLQGAGSSLRQVNLSENVSPLVAFGTAGPSNMKADLIEQKARWVEGMIQQVNKSASAEKNREDKEKYFADMGRVGGTRRVVLRSPSGAAGETGR